uniref:CLP-POGU3 n=1 Tax=Pogona barbata TaxID=52202 RepID=Q2XXN8_POGBA|nr:CLP-POGU3 [Pogona barbata]
MKLLAILSAVLFFVLMAASVDAGPSSSSGCHAARGYCYFMDCPRGRRQIGNCGSLRRPCCK